MDFNKPANDLTADDLQAVLGVAEGHRLEYKRDAYARNDEGTREMLRDVCSFANSGGGYLLIGVDADSEQRAIAFPGIEKGADEASRMMSSINAAIEERIIGLNVGIVPIAQGRDVLVLEYSSQRSFAASGDVQGYVSVLEAPRFTEVRNDD